MLQTSAYLSNGIMDNQAKLKEIQTTLGVFFDKFQLDSHGIIVLECFFEELYGKTLPVLGEKGQEGDAIVKRLQCSQGRSPD